MKWKVILALVIAILFCWLMGGLSFAGEYTAKGGEDCAKAAKNCKCICNSDELAKMNKITDPKAKLIAGQKLICLTEKEVEAAKKWCENKHKEFEYGTGEYSKNFADLNNLRAKRIEYNTDDPVPYGIYFTEVLEYAKKTGK